VHHAAEGNGRDDEEEGEEAHPFLRVKFPAKPQVPQRMSSAARSEPQKKTFVPMINIEWPIW
jgi:hypothetical protein